MVESLTIGPFQAHPELAPLFDRNSRAEGSWRWFNVLAETTVAPDDTVLVAMLTGAGGAPVAALPLVRSQNRALRALTSPYTTCFTAPLGSTDTARTIGRLLRPHVRTHLHVDALDPNAAGAAALLEGLRDGGLWTATYQHFANWYERIEDFDVYWGSRRSTLREIIRRKGRKLAALGRLEFSAPDDAAGIWHAVQIYEAIYAKSWKRPEPHPAFIARMVNDLQTDGSARIALVHIDGEPAAAQIWLTGDRKATIFKLAQDQRFDRYSPGTLLTHWLLAETVRRQPGTEVDFGRGDDAYKRDWLSARRYRAGVIACNPTTAGGLLDAGRWIAPMKLARIAKRFKQNAVSDPAT